MPLSLTPSVPNAPSVSASTVTGSPITVTTESAGTVLVFNGTTQLITFTAVVGANTYTPSSAGVYTFKLQTANGTSGASTAVTVTDLATTKDLLTLDLTLSANAALLKVGGYVRQSNIVVVLVAANTYAVVTQICSHEGQKQGIYQSREFYCQSHRARFITSGVGLNGNGKSGLTVYKTS